MTSYFRTAAMALALVLVVAACGGDDDAAAAADSTEATATTSPEDAPTTTAGTETTTTPDTVVPAPATTAAPPENNGDDIADAGELVAVHYTGTLDDGEEFDSSLEREPLEFIVGSGQVIPGFDAAVTGMKIGETVVVSIPPEDAYGVTDPEAIIDFPIEEVPEEFRVEGIQVSLGNGLPATVIAVTEDTVTIDANHPLAGETLTFDLELIEIKG